MSIERWRVVIVEDDHAVSYVHRELIERTGRFHVVEAVASGEQAVLAVRRSSPHLVLLDLTLAGTDGLTALRRLRAEGSEVEVIAVTAATSTRVVRNVVQLGVVDYLVKPFSPERLEQALSLFLHRMRTLRNGDFGQSQIDAYTSSGRVSPRWLPKGLAEGPLREVRVTLEEATAWLPAEAIAEQVGISRVTARRYLEYLVTTDQAAVESRSDGPGRPRKFYRECRAARRPSDPASA